MAFTVSTLIFYPDLLSSHQGVFRGLVSTAGESKAPFLLSLSF